jgi:hypothetical protein
MSTSDVCHQSLAGVFSNVRQYDSHFTAFELGNAIILNEKICFLSIQNSGAEQENPLLLIFQFLHPLAHFFEKLVFSCGEASAAAFP